MVLNSPCLSATTLFFSSPTANSCLFFKTSLLAQELQADVSCVARCSLIATIRLCLGFPIFLVEKLANFTTLTVFPGNAAFSALPSIFKSTFNGVFISWSECPRLVLSGFGLVLLLVLLGISFLLHVLDFEFLPNSFPGTSFSWFEASFTVDLSDLLVEAQFLLTFLILKFFLFERLFTLPFEVFSTIFNLPSSSDDSGSSSLHVFVLSGAESSNTNAHVTGHEYS